MSSKEVCINYSSLLLRYHFIYNQILMRVEQIVLIFALIFLANAHSPSESSFIKKEFNDQFMQSSKFLTKVNIGLENSLHQLHHLPQNTNLTLDFQVAGKLKHHCFPSSLPIIIHSILKWTSWLNRNISVCRKQEKKKLISWLKIFNTSKTHPRS